MLINMANNKCNICKGTGINRHNDNSPCDACDGYGVNNERIVRRFLFRRKTLINGSYRFKFVKIFQRYRYDNGWSSGVYRGWHWADVCFVN